MSEKTRPRIGLVHALHASIAPIDAAFAELWSEAEALSLYDQSLYVDFNRIGHVNEEIARRIESLLRFSADAGAQAILFTGSLFGDSVEAARVRVPVPVLTAYEAMIEEAFEGVRRPRLGLLATAAGTAGMIHTDIEKYAKANDLEYELDARTIDGAIDALLAGDRERHDELVVGAAADMVDCDVLLLGQFSMAPVAKRLEQTGQRRVLNSPGSAVAKLRRVLGA